MSQTVQVILEGLEHVLKSAAPNSSTSNYNRRVWWIG